MQKGVKTPKVEWKNGLSLSRKKRRKFFFISLGPFIKKRNERGESFLYYVQNKERETKVNGKWNEIKFSGSVGQNFFCFQKILMGKNGIFIYYWLK
ncbi:MAG: hypothetical protein CM15mP31_3180 [Gammaproteobacteria bacterium]|nr:MAG: hypothetical protein CM15mP31_3180 [Gammaproteobacteria bacterium]